MSVLLVRLCVVAGKDTSEDYVSDSDDDSVDEGVISDDKEVDATVFMDAYRCVTGTMQRQ